jgi:hypothetical protein
MAEICHSSRMFRTFRKLVALLFAIWLPLFSGSALAASITMQTSNRDCHPVAVQQNDHYAHQISIAHHHDSHHNDLTAANQGQLADGQQDQHNFSCKDCSVCHFACSGYLATSAIKVTEARLSAQAYATSSTPFESFTSAPLDPPPLSRV